MKYIIRAIKYFVYVSVIASSMLIILALLGFVSSDINVMFKNGWGSVGQILLMFACVALFYPRFGFTKRLATVLGDTSGLRDAVVDYMGAKGYLLESEDGERMCFRSSSTFNRLARMLEDRITIEKGLGGFYVEGPSKDVARIVTGLEFKFRNAEEDSK